jgi:hypothetical protein
MYTKRNNIINEIPYTSIFTSKNDKDFLLLLEFQIDFMLAYHFIDVLILQTELEYIKSYIDQMDSLYIIFKEVTGSTWNVIPEYELKNILVSLSMINVQNSSYKWIDYKLMSIKDYNYIINVYTSKS